MRKNTITQRLNIIKGQINGLANLIEKKEDSDDMYREQI